MFSIFVYLWICCLCLCFFCFVLCLFFGCAVCVCHFSFLDYVCVSFVVWGLVGIGREWYMLLRLLSLLLLLLVLLIWQGAQPQALVIAEWLLTNPQLLLGRCPLSLIIAGLLTNPRHR